MCERERERESYREGATLHATSIRREKRHFPREIFLMHNLTDLELDSVVGHGERLGIDIVNGIVNPLLGQIVEESIFVEKTIRSATTAYIHTVSRTTC